MTEMSAGHDDRANYLVVMLTQSMLGLVSDAVRGVALEVRDDEVRLYFAVTETTSEQQDDLDEIVADFEAFLYPDTPKISVEVGDELPSRSDAGFRQVFRAKDRGRS